MKLNKMEQSFINTKTPAEFMKNQYEFALKYMSIIMPIFAGLIIAVGIALIFVMRDSFWWIGLIFAGVGLLTIGWLFIMRAYIKGKMQALNEYLENQSKE